MSKRTNPPHNVAVAIAVAALSLPIMSAAHAKSDVHRARHHHARIYNTTRDPATVTGWSDPPALYSPRPPGGKRDQQHLAGRNAHVSWR